MWGPVDNADVARAQVAVPPKVDGLGRIFFPQLP